jgi:osmotically-inducible protein OsmY
MMTASSATLPTPADSEDEYLARKVRNFILSRIQPASNEVEVNADSGTVILRGRVGSFYHKQLWLSGAQRVAGVRRVIDEIDVSSRLRG